jgi:hypothetical protein
MSVKSKVMAGFVLAGAMAVAGCIVPDPFYHGGYGHGYHGGAYVYSEYPRTRVVHRRYYTNHAYRDDRNDDWRWHDRDYRRDDGHWDDADD